MKTEQPGNPAGRSNRARSVDVIIVAPAYPASAQPGDCDSDFQK